MLKAIQKSSISHFSQLFTI